MGLLDILSFPVVFLSKVIGLDDPNSQSSKIFWLGAILAGCFLNNVVLEMIIQIDRGAGGLMTFFQFIFVAVVLSPGYISFTDPETKKWKLSLIHKTPIREYLVMTIMFFLISVANNKAFVLGISQPFNVIFRSLSLLISFLIGLVWFKKSYSMKQFISVCLVTIGVMITTAGEVYLKSSLPMKLERCCGHLPLWKQAYIAITQDPVLGDHTATSSEMVYWEMLILAVATCLLLFTLLGLAVLGHLQAEAYKKYNSTPEENMFYLHLMPIPMFATLFQDLGDHFTLWNNSAPYNVLGLFEIPWLWWLCILNILTQYICIKGVHNTTSKMGTLVCTFATTIRKFLTLIFSVLYFKSPFTAIHLLGAAFVFIGTYLFAVAPNNQNTKTETSSVKKNQ